MVNKSDVDQARRAHIRRLKMLSAICLGLVIFLLAAMVLGAIWLASKDVVGVVAAWLQGAV